MCECNTQIVCTVFSTICTGCGLEKTFITPQIQTYNATTQSCIVISPYSRKHRFTCLLRKILGVDSGPPCNDRVWHFLSASAPFTNTDAIIACLKNSSIKTKYYNSLHVFSKAFLKNYRQPLCKLEPLVIESLLETMFDEVMFRWNRFQPSLSFFSYAWLLEKLLKHLNIFHIYKPYLKLLVCPNRRRKYASRWESLHLTPKPLPTDSPLYQSGTHATLPGIV